MKHLDMKKLKTVVGVGLALLAGNGITSNAIAADQMLSCTVAFQDDGQNAQIKVMQVKGHPELQVFDLKMKIRIRDPRADFPAAGYADVQGLLVARIHDRTSVTASGLVYIQPDSADGTLINPEWVTLQGRVENGIHHLALYDVNHVLQGGFGLRIQCR